MFHVLMSASFIVRPIIASSLRSAPSCVLGLPPHEASSAISRLLHAAGTPSPRGATALRPSGVRNSSRTNQDYICIFTRLLERATEGRRGISRGDGFFWGNFSTALAGGRGAASASTASRSQAPRGGSSAPLIWWRCSSACPRRVPSAPRRSLRTAKVWRRASWLGRELDACDGLRGRK